MYQHLSEQILEQLLGGVEIRVPRGKKQMLRHSILEDDLFTLQNMISCVVGQLLNELPSLKIKCLIILLLSTWLWKVIYIIIMFFIVVEYVE